MKVAALSKNDVNYLAAQCFSLSHQGSDLATNVTGGQDTSSEQANVAPEVFESVCSFLAAIE